MKKWRLIPHINTNGARQMAIDEAILIARINNLVPNTLRFYTWQPQAVSIGFFQDLQQEINLRKAQDLNIDIVRRYSGGGAVFHEHELTYSLVMKESDLNLNVLDSYKYLCQGVILGLKDLGISAHFKAINDILVGNKKISGNAQTRKKGVILQHGTILLSVDVDKMFSVLKVSSEKIKDKLVSQARDSVSSVSNELNTSKLDYNYLNKVFANSFSKALKIVLFSGALSDREKEISKELYQNKYLSQDWNYYQKYNNTFYE